MGRKGRTFKDMREKTCAAQPRPRIPSISIRLEHRRHPHHQHHSRQGLLPQPKAEGDGVGEHVQPEDAEEEGAEGVEHFCEEVPPESAVGGEVGEVEGGEVDGGEEGAGWEEGAGEEGEEG